MSTIGASVMTLADYAKGLGPDHKIARVIELLNQQNEALEDIDFREGNLPTGTRTVVRTGMPTVYWRMINQGVPTSKSTKAQIDALCGRMEAWSSVDEALAELAPDLGAFRLSEATSFIEAMNQEAASTLFYGTLANPEEFVGLTPHYSSLSAANAQNIINAGGVGSDNSSIWLVVWGENTVHGIYPKGTTAGLDHKDLGLQTVQVTASVTPTQLRAYQDQFIWRLGLVVKDWRYAVRICNIDVSNLVNGTVSAADLAKLMSRAIDRIPSFSMGRAAFYANRTIKSMLRVQAMDKSQNVLSVQESATQYGNPVRGGLSFLGIPIRTCDALTEAETLVA